MKDIYFNSISFVSFKKYFTTFNPLRLVRFVEPVKLIESCAIADHPSYSHKVAEVEQRIGFLLYEYYCSLRVEDGI